jgi:hypothetical protein
MAGVAAEFARECGAILERQAARVDRLAALSIRPFAAADASEIDACEHDHAETIKLELKTVFAKFKDRLGETFYDAIVEVRSRSELLSSAGVTLVCAAGWKAHGASAGADGLCGSSLLLPGGTAPPSAADSPLAPPRCFTRSGACGTCVVRLASFSVR